METEKFAIVYVEITEDRTADELKSKMESVLGKESFTNFWLDEVVDGDEIVGS